MTLPLPGPLVYGVDFGMSTSSLAILFADGTTRLVSDPALRVGARHAVPTAVCLDDSGDELLVGREAVNARLERQDGYRDNFKLDVVVGAPPVVLADRSFEVVELVAAVLRFLRDRAQEVDPRDPAATVITVPVGWAEGRRKMITQAAVTAGFAADTLYLIEEPVAAIEYVKSLDLTRARDTVLVYDLGGGTFDCAVIAPARGDQPDIRLKDSRPIGGRNFDNRLLGELEKKFPDEVGALRTSGELVRQMSLLDSCESLKRRLSDQEQTREVLTELSPAVDVTITRHDFENLIRDQIEETLACCQAMMAEANLTWNAIDAVVPVGGSSRIPLVEEKLRARAPGRVRTTEHRDTAVARGAALLARQQADRIQPTSPPQAQKLTPSMVWVPRARWEEPPVVGGRVEDRVDRGLLLGAWGTFIPSGLGAVAVALRYWHGSSGWLIIVIAASLVSGIWLTAWRARNPTYLAVIMTTAMYLVAVLFLWASVVYGDRFFGEHGPGPVSLFWDTMVVGGVAFVSAVLLNIVATQIDQARTSRRAVDEDATVTQQMLGQRWFGATQASPDFMEPLFAMPAMRGFELSTSSGSAFKYGSRPGHGSCWSRCSAQPTIGRNWKPPPRPGACASRPTRPP